MAHNDLEELYTYRKTMDPSLELLDQVIKLLETEGLAGRTPSFNIFGVLEKAKDERQKIVDRKARLEKFATCEHVPGIENNVGNDSHYEYYETRCSKCGKVLEERKH